MDILVDETYIELPKLLSKSQNVVFHFQNPSESEGYPHAISGHHLAGQEPTLLCIYNNSIDQILFYLWQHGKAPSGCGEINPYKSATLQSTICDANALWDHNCKISQ